MGDDEWTSEAAPSTGIAFSAKTDPNNNNVDDGEKKTGFRSFDRVGFLFY
jgi:hypothetical protein